MDAYYNNLLYNVHMLNFVPYYGEINSRVLLQIYPKYLYL